MIVKNIMLKNVIINWIEAQVDYHISLNDIFDYHIARELPIYNFQFYILSPERARAYTYYYPERVIVKKYNHSIHDYQPRRCLS